MASNTTLDDHGERLRTLEGTVGEINTSTALHAERLQILNEKIGEGFKAITDRLDRGAAQFDSHEKRLDEHHDKLLKIETQELGRSRRWSVIKKAIVPLLAAAAGIIAHAGGGWIWGLVAKLFGGE